MFLVYRDGCVVLPRGAMGLSSVCDCVFSDHTHLLFFLQNSEPDLDPNFSSLFPVSTYYIRNQATGVSLAGRYWAVMGCWLDIAVILLVCGKKNQHTKRL